MNGSMIEISDVVSQAIKNNEPLVALESTIITHGMPYPANLQTALKVENTIKAKVYLHCSLISFDETYSAFRFNNPETKKSHDCVG